MARALHLLPPSPEFQTRRAADQLRGAVADLVKIDLHPMPRPHWTRVVRTALALRGKTLRAYDVVHAFDAVSLNVAAMGGATKIIYSPSAFPTLGAVKWLRSVMGVRNVQVVCPTSTMRRAYVERGVPFERCHLIRPAVDFSKINRRRDATLRAALGYTDTDVVLLAPGETVRNGGHLEAAWVGVVMNQLDAKFQTMIWGRGPYVAQAERFATNVCGEGFLRNAEKRLGRRLEFEELLPAADVVVVAPTVPVPTLPIAICMAAALPIVATVTYTVSELLEDRHSALMVPAPRQRLISRRILDLMQDTQLQWSISDVARTEAYEYFSASRFNQQWRDVYNQFIQNNTVELPDPTPGAGLRFHGRA